MDEIVWIKEEQSPASPLCNQDSGAAVLESLPHQDPSPPNSPLEDSESISIPSQPQLADTTSSSRLERSAVLDFQKTFASEQSSAQNSASTTKQNGSVPAVKKEVTWIGENGDKEEEEKENELSITDEFDVSEYERKLRENTERTMSLVTDLCERSDALKEQQQTALQRLSEERTARQETVAEMEKVVKLNEELAEQRTELEKQVISLKQTASELMAVPGREHIHEEIKWHTVDSARIGDCFLKEPTGAVVLPSGNVFVADHQLGLFLFSLNSELVRKVSDPSWKYAQAAALTHDNHVLVSVMAKEEGEATTWKRFIYKFDEQLNFIARVEGPKWIAEETITTERLCASSSGFIYLVVSGETFSALYELSPDVKWTELCHKRGQTFVDVQTFAIVGPITELLVVEQRRGYVFMFSVRDSEICARKSLALVEKPGPICMDETRQLFVTDLGQGKVRQLETMDLFEPIRDVALADRSLHAVSANRGFIALTYRENNLVRLHKYRSIK